MTPMLHRCGYGLGFAASCGADEAQSVDSNPGWNIDALWRCGKIAVGFLLTPKNSASVKTHDQPLLDFPKPARIHVMLRVLSPSKYRQS